MKRIGFCLAALLALGAVVPANAHDTRIPSEAVIDYGTGSLPECDPNCFAGVVYSPKHACEVGRTAKVFHRDEGPDTFVNSARTDADGIWRFVADDDAQGPYYAKALRRDIGQAGHRHVCKAARSPTIVIP